MNVGIMRVRMFEPLVPVRMRMRFSSWISRRVFMLMMDVMNVFMLMCHWLVNVEMLMTFSQVQPHSDRH